jgi:hypothetical protein
MKKIYLTLLVLGATLLNSCSSSTETTPAPSFKINGVTYELLTSDTDSFNITNMISTPVVFGGQNYVTSIVTIGGTANNSSKGGAVAFTLFYKASQGIAGTYNITNMDDDLEVDLAANQRTVNGWVSVAIVSNTSSQSSELELNDPLGSVQLISNGGNNYTLKFNNVFRKLNSNNQVTASYPVEIDITGTASIDNL